VFGAVPDDGIALARVGEQLLGLGPLGVVARRLVGEHGVGVELLQLPVGVLVEAADADVADASPLGHDPFLLSGKV
jgi:hypothetical protein